MRLKVLSVIIGSMCVTLTTSLRCQQTSGGEKENVDCMFPFKYAGKEFNECTDINDPDNKLWCSTKVGPNREHLRGNWGYCSTGKAIEYL